MMDDPNVDESALRGSLRYIRGVNRALGGQRALLGHLRRWSGDWATGEKVTLLDIATGSADLPIAAVRWASRKGIDLRVTGVDNHSKTLAIAREQVGQDAELSDRIELIESDALELIDRFGTRSFDYVHAGLFLHHLTDIRVQTMLRIMERLARRGVIWNDLIRSPIARAGIFVLTLGRSKIIRHDARVSVAAGFTKGEALNFARRSWEHKPTIRTSLLSQRFTVTCEKQVV